ncbi:MAG: MarR family winged helix-turn-helix transcriptional regulator [Actinomycetota bacterium]|nr:MarR family winged helix-turn-helix transcriptional regulator [Actinomycetota bacterium]
MSVTPETASALSSTIVRVVKILTSMRSHMPLTTVTDVPGLDHSHFSALFTLAHEPQRVSSLAESIHSDVSTVSRQVTHLVQVGLVEKIHDPDDGRAQLLSLTPTGRQVIDDLIASRGQWFEHMLAGWSEAEATSFLTHLDRFGDACASFKTELGLHPAGSHTLVPSSPSTHHTTHPQEH